MLESDAVGETAVAAAVTVPPPPVAVAVLAAAGGAERVTAAACDHQEATLLTPSREEGARAESDGAELPESA